MRWMNDPKNKLLEKAKVAEVTLRDTIFAYDSNKDRMLPSEPIEMIKLLGENTEVDTQESLALSRSKKFRSMGNWLPERSVKQRKAFYCAENTGYFQREVTAPNPMNMMTNPDMMNNMLKQNIQSVIHMFMFSGIGSVFQGFITAQIPFPLGYKFKQMLQQGLMVSALDSTYTSSMSWAFLLVYGLNGVLGMMLQDSKTLEEMELMASGAGMVQAQGGMGQQKNYKALFKNERDFYQIISWKHKLEDVEQAFLEVHKAGGRSKLSF